MGSILPHVIFSVKLSHSHLDSTESIIKNIITEFIKKQ